MLSFAEISLFPPNRPTPPFPLPGQRLSLPSSGRRFRPVRYAQQPRHHRPPTYDRPKFPHRPHLPLPTVRTQVRVFFQKALQPIQQVQLRRNRQFAAKAQQRPRLPPLGFRLAVMQAVMPDAPEAMG
jgi:hypothetical protein